MSCLLTQIENSKASVQTILIPPVLVERSTCQRCWYMALSPRLYLLSFVLFIYFPTIWWRGDGTEQVAWVWKRYLTIVPVQATITATRFALEKKDRLRLIWRSRSFDQYADQYQKISGWTQWTRQWFVPAETGAKSAGKHPIAGLWRPDVSSHAGGHWFESSSLHQKVPDFARNQELFFTFHCFLYIGQCIGQAWLIHWPIRR